MSSERPVAVVTGAARGIGRRVALTLAERGYRVAANDLEAPEGTLDELEWIGNGVLSLPGDVADEEAVRGMVGAVVERFGRVEALVNNAGISLISPAEETSLSDWRRVLEVNLTGPFLMCREFGKVMLGQGSGSVVNVGSVAGLLGVADRAAYNASKHGLVGLTRTLAAEWGGRGVRVNAVCPGWVKTEMDVEDQAGGATPTRTSSGASRWAASPHRKTSRGPSHSSPTPNRAASSTATPSPWTAAGSATGRGRA